MSNSSVDYQAGVRAGALAEQQRIKSILTCRDAVGQSHLAMCLAFDQNESLEVAQGILAAAADSSANAKRIREIAAAKFGKPGPVFR